MTTRHQRYLKPLHEDHDPKAIKNDTDTENDATKNADLPIAESVAPRRSSRLHRIPSPLKTVKSIKMGAEQSTPLSVEVKLEVENGTITLKEVNASEGKA